MIILDILSSALVAQSVYYYLVPHFGSLAPLGSITTELSVECFVSTAITFISQLFFVNQIYAVSKGRRSWVIPSVVSVLAFAAFAFGVACTTSMVIFKHNILTGRNATFALFFGLAKGFGAAADIVSTIALCVFLSSSRSGITQTNSLINSLMQFVIHRGALVTLIQTLLLVTFFSAPQHLYWLAFHVNVTKLYVNVFFAMLNARDALSQKHSIGSISTSVSLTTSNNYGRYPTDVMDLKRGNHAIEEMPSFAAKEEVEAYERGGVAF